MSKGYSWAVGFIYFSYSPSYFQAECVGQDVCAAYLDVVLHEVVKHDCIADV